MTVDAVGRTRGHGVGDGGGQIRPPHPESAHEHLALRHGRHCAVRLLRPTDGAGLLLERAEPGDDLSSLPVLEACEVIAGLYARLHRPALPQLDRLSDHAARWAGSLPCCGIRTSYRDGSSTRRSVSLTASPTDPTTDSALIHTDLHYFNVLAAVREPGSRSIRSPWPATRRTRSLRCCGIAGPRPSRPATYGMRSGNGCSLSSTPPAGRGPVPWLDRAARTGERALAHHRSGRADRPGAGSRPRPPSSRPSSAERDRRRVRMPE